MSYRAIIGTETQQSSIDFDGPQSSGVPAILGYCTVPNVAPAQPLLTASFTGPDAFRRFVDELGSAKRTVASGPQAEVDPYLASAVQGFFDCGGGRCFVGFLNVVDLDAEWKRAVDWLLDLDAADLVCAPSLMSAAWSKGDTKQIWERQLELLNLCQARGDCFAILDLADTKNLERLTTAVPDETIRRCGATYFPWVAVDDHTEAPACGHIAGVYARCDRLAGPHRAPANELLHGIVDLAYPNTAPANADISVDRAKAPSASGWCSTNELQILPGRGIRVVGARTLLGTAKSPWAHVSVRRSFIAVVRRLTHLTAWAAFEPNDLRLWIRITRQLQSYLSDLYNRGALKGSSAELAFYVKCDDETNPPEVREAGCVVVEIGLALVFPAEFIKLRLTQAASGASITGSP